MTDQPRRRDDRIFDPSYTEGLQTLPTAELRSRRGECEQYEAELSYTRRLLHGKLDIIRHEIERRVQGGEGGNAALLEKLPSILSDANGNGGDGPSGQVRYNPILMPANADMQRREVERIASETLLGEVDKLSEAELEALVTKLSAAEEEASDTRRKILQVIDLIGEELVRRYKEGHEDPSALLSK